MIVTGCDFREGAHSERLTKQTDSINSTILSRQRVDGGVVHCLVVNTSNCTSFNSLTDYLSSGDVGAFTLCLCLVAISSFLDPFSSLPSRLLQHQFLDGPPNIRNPDWH